MKEGWEIKKLDDVCRINYGTRVVQKRDGGSIYPVYGGGGATFRMDKYNREDCLIVSRFAMSPQCVRYVKGKFFLNDSGLSLESSLPILSQKFLNKHIIALNDKIYSLGKGAAQRNLDINALKSLDIHYPISLGEQERIVGELDCLSGVIEKKKEQLKDLDLFAQSIFYEMFGNPVENDRGWEVKKLGEISDVTSFKRVLIEDVVESGIPFIRGTELSALSKMPNSKDYKFTLFITPEHYERVKAISGVPAVGDLLIPSINSDGLIWELDTDEPRYYKDGRVLWIHVNHQYSNSKALKYILGNKLRLMYNELASGATFVELKLFVLRDMLLPFPPLSLQQEFASKIEAIEKQKGLIRKSIEEVETLFNSRMDYYFG